jgi:formiminoglutamase
MSLWTGRVDTADGPNALRWHQMVTPLAPGVPPGIVLIGFACDEGVRRNGGRFGAKDGPRAIRQALANLAWHQHCPVYDAGDVRCDDGDMEGAQTRLSEIVASAISSGQRPLILGGGHETAWGTFQGIVAAKPQAAVGVINIDAHLDLRADEPGNSGTPFFQIAEWCERKKRPFRYLCLGLAFAANTAALMNRATTMRVRWRCDSDVVPWQFQALRDEITSFAQSAGALHLSIDLDVLPAAIMPAVSAPAGRGISLESLDSLIMLALCTRKVTAVDIVEFNPRFDTEGNAVRVAARFAWDVAQGWNSDGGPPVSREPQASASLSRSPSRRG